MSADADTHTSARISSLAARQAQEHALEERDRREREKYGKGIVDTKGGYVREQEKLMLGGAGGGVGVGDMLRRGTAKAGYRGDE